MRTRFLRGTTADNNGITLLEGELSIDEEKKAVRLHDGVTPGGFEIVGTPVDLPLPGPTTLQAGDSTTGFYGETTEAELITEADLVSALGLSLGVSINPSITWLKFSLDGKTLYVAKTNVRHSVSWSALYQAGAVYGDDTVGAFPVNEDTVQDARVTIDGTQYRVRLLKGADADPTAMPRGTNSPAGSEVSEWNRLMYPIHLSDPTAAGWGINYTDEDITVGSNDASWCQETEDGTTTRRVNRGYNGVEWFLTTPHNYGNDSNKWRPVLEPIV